MKPDGYWCTECECIAEGKLCKDNAIPVVKPLATPEPTTWGESRGEETITLHDVVTNAGSVPRWTVGDNERDFVDSYSESYWMAEHGKCLVKGDIVQAMNFLERRKPCKDIA
jgi:hypothetical protein